MKHTFPSFLLLSACLFTPLQCFAQQLPQLKVDISISGRGDAETLEPGYEVWRPAQGTSTSQDFGDITCTLSCPEGAGYVLRTGWSKTYIQNADYKAQNGRLTGDGISLDPATGVGEITLTLQGLPAGTHTLQTYHNRWENPANFSGWPIFVKVNGEVIHNQITTTFWESVSANACLLTTVLDVPQSGDPVSVTFYTLEDVAPDNVAEKPNTNKAPIINGFELNTVSITSQAKAPSPTSGDLHVDADDKTCLLSWSPANNQVAAHRLYVGLDSASVAAMEVPLAEKTAADTTYLLEDLYSMNTYYWRVDEVDAQGNVTVGNVWNFRPRQLAFPGAEGYGRYATGGRGGVVYHVTNLNHDHNPGSFLYGLTDLEGPRTIVFDVSGIIEMDFGSVFSDKFVTIAAQTAPGKGICLKYSNLNICSENICRFLRAYRGYGDTGNALGMSGADHAIVDHTTAAWGTDETVSGRGAKNISFQYSMIAEALGIADHKNYPSGTNHGYAATIDGKIGSWHHNLLVNCEGRNWSMGGGMDGNNTAIGQMDIFNNVVYNWHNRTTDGGCHEVNFVNNYYKMGADTNRKVLFSQDYENIGSAESKWQAYIHGNIRENKDHTLSQDKLNDTYRYTLSNGAVDPNTRNDEYQYNTFVNEPFFPSFAVIHTAQEALKVVTSNSGATMPCRNDHHRRVVNETVTGTYTYVGSRSKIKGEIDHENDCGGFEAYPEEKRDADFDTDQDGMPNWYEVLIGSDPEVANNNDDPDRDGWTLLEDYLEFMAHPYLVVAPGQTQTFEVAPEFVGFTKSPVYSIDCDEASLFEATISEGIVTVRAKERGGIGIVGLKVTDAEGSTYEQRLSVAVTGDPAAIHQVFDEHDLEVVKREFFTTDGKPVTQMQSHEVYVMRLTEANGQVHTMKVLAE